VTWKLLTYRAEDGRPRAGVLVGDRVHDAAALAGRAEYVSTLDVLADWPEASRRLDAATRPPSGASRALADTALLAPVLQPGAIYCAGANYSDHMAEMAKVMNMPQERDPHEAGLKPWHFLKTSRGSVVGPGVAVAIPAYAKLLDWEIELVAVIGRPCRNVSIDAALGYVAGYTIANDLSARDHVKREGVGDHSPFKWDWISQKCFEGACPLGPWIVPAPAIPDPQNLALRLWVGNELMQDSHSSRMIFSTAEQIAHLSTRITLFPGDLVLTGTPSGVGMARRRFLQPGETVRLAIESIGELVHRIA
jgi:2-keto-4-pentenoate hydratase/2-oxohepta-3-ene-1,7-dioic acid hydratase in catechol pathway